MRARRLGACISIWPPASITPERNSIDEMCPSPMARRLKTKRCRRSESLLVGRRHDQRIAQRGGLDRVLVGEIGADEQLALHRELVRSGDVSRRHGREVRLENRPQVDVARGDRACVVLQVVLTSDSDNARILDRMRSTRERPSTECSLPGVNGFVITRVGSGTNRAEVFVTGMVRISTVLSHGQGVASGNIRRGVLRRGAHQTEGARGLSSRPCPHDARQGW